ncbi:spf31 [Candida pseudojiufengensis]|uniref:spf31 n=1 Tax=Candida pseudojiufengensis TaxID=497109 RepID=UPI0022255D3C|nr:spf31 [Candida pseudojiufengensis]KAI5966817.1 spf31 [Candida pseudojiufengensis]
MDDLNRILSIEESALNRNNEIDRVLKCSDHDFFDIMQFNPLTIEFDEIPSLVKKIYRKKSLLIHPDKSDHPQASVAFDKLNQSMKILSTTDEDVDEYKEKERLYSIYNHFKKDSEIIDSNFNHENNIKIREKVNEILINELADEELTKLAKQSEEIRKNEMYQKLKDENNAKRKLENQWEENRDDRVKNWRNYSNKIEKKKKKSKFNGKKLKKLA